MEMSIYVHLYAKEYFKDDIGTLPRYPDEDTKKDLVWKYAAAYLTESWICTQLWDEATYTWAGEADDPKPYFGIGTPYRDHINRRAKEIMEGSPIIVERIGFRDENLMGWFEKWHFPDPSLLIKHRFPWAEEMLGKLGVKEFSIC